MFDHVGLHVSDRAAAEPVYERLLDTLGFERDYTGDAYAEWNDFAISQSNDERPPTRNLHLGFVSPSRDHVDRFWREGVAAGWRDDGEPGPRPRYRHDYYGGFLRDPDDNSIEAVHHGALRTDGVIDHLWIRVADVPASKRFYELVAEHAGFRLKHDSPGRAQFVGSTGSFSVVAGRPTENLHMAFPADGNGTVEEFHGALIAAGYRDNGEPGERPIYHDGYYAAFVLDPDGNNVEVVNHNR